MTTTMARTTTTTITFKTISALLPWRDILKIDHFDNTFIISVKKRASLASKYYQDTQVYNTLVQYLF